MTYSFQGMVGEPVLQILHSLQETFVLHWFYSWVNACIYLYEICIPIVTVHLVKAITRSYAPCVSGEKKSPTRYPLHSRLKRHFVFCIMIICSNIAVEEKAVGRSNTSVYYSVRRGVIVTNFFIVLQCYFYRQSASAMHGRHRPVFLTIRLRMLLHRRYSDTRGTVV